MNWCMAAFCKVQPHRSAGTSDERHVTAMQHPPSSKAVGVYYLLNLLPLFQRGLAAGKYNF